MSCGGLLQSDNARYKWTNYIENESFNQSSKCAARLGYRATIVCMPGNAKVKGHPLAPAKNTYSQMINSTVVRVHIKNFVNVYVDSFGLVASERQTKFFCLQFRGECDLFTNSGVFAIFKASQSQRLAAHVI